MNKLDRLQRIIAIAFVLLVVLGVALIFLVPGYLDSAGRKRSEEFCAAVQVGKSIETVVASAKSLNIELSTWPPQDGKTRYQAWFGGFLSNAFTCEILAEGGNGRHPLQ